MRSGRHHPGSFTLIEVTVALSIGLLISGIIYSFWLFGMRTGLGTTNELFLHGRVRTNLQRLVRELRAAKFITQVKKNRISFSRFFDPDIEPHTGAGGDSDFKKIEYYLKKEGDSSRFVRREYGEEVVLFECDQITEDLFFPYFDEKETRQLKPFDMDENDSGKRGRITFIRIRINLVHRKRPYFVATSVTLRTPYQEMTQPTWNLKR